MTVAKDWRQLADEISAFRNTQTLHPKYLFRGQARSDWTLEPSFTRIANKRALDRTQALQLEREIVNKFSISGSKLLPNKALHLPALPLRSKAARSALTLHRGQACS